ncbi:recombinase family protein [Actinomadura litoris]|uniref:recombinase family protein n=1 Tax=Actinomadura litoris TaxID=2678616 RepID=UPI001FA76511|nr:recombinase family protein [Actinomadura litoris]
MAFDFKVRFDVSALPIDEYTRVSVDKKGNGVSVADQHDDNLDCAEELGFEHGEWFNDSDKRASLGAKARPEWDRYLDKVRAGRSGGINIWDVARASRDLGIGFELVKIVRDYGLKGFRVISSSTALVYDLSDDIQANDFQEELVKAEKEALVIRRRVRRAHKRKARRGELSGGPRRKFGFIDAYNNLHHAEERDLIREADDFLREQGRPMKDLVKAWGARGVVTPEIWTNDGSKIVFKGGQPFNHTRIKDMLLRSINAGYARYRDGELIGKLPGDPVLEPANYLELREILASQKRGRPRTNVFLLTGFGVEKLRCGPCRSWMAGAANGTGASKEQIAKGWKVRPYYRCTHNPYRPGRVGCLQSIDMVQLDEILTGAAFEWWTDPERLARDVVIHTDTAEVRELDHKLSVYEARHERLVLSTEPGVEKSLATLEARMASLREQRERLVSPAIRQATTLEQILERWNSGPEARREMVREAYRVIEIWPPEDGGKGFRRFDSDRIKAVFADQPPS